MSFKFALLAATAAVSASARIDAPGPGQFGFDYYLENGRSSYESNGARLDGWEDALLAQLRKTKGRSLARAAASLAAREGMTPQAMGELIELWLRVRGQDDPERITAAQRDALFGRYAALYAATGQHPLVLQAAAASLLQDNGCTAAGVTRLAKLGEPAEMLPLIAEAGEQCVETGMQLARAAPAKGLAPLLRGLDWFSMRDADAAAVLQYVLTPEGLARFAPQDRPVAQLVYTASLIRKLAALGDTQGVIATFEAQDPALRERLLALSLPAQQITLDGTTLALSAQGEHGKPDRAIALTLAESYFLTGNDTAARALLDRWNAAAVRAQFACMAEPGVARQKVCVPDGKLAIDDGLLQSYLLLDHGLNDPASDPYAFAEFRASGWSNESRIGVEALVDCRIFSEANLAQTCAHSREATASTDQDSKTTERDTLAQMAALVVPDFNAAATRLLAARTARFGAPVARDWQRFADRPAAEPAALPWTAQPLPPQFAARRAGPAWQKSWAALPPGFMPVRIDWSGARVAVISLSQALDPNGEVSPGGYWLHLSQDGGKSWAAPLYTGLADRFPYTVIADAAMPLLDGEDLTLAVDEALLDTRSISYPPVGLRTLRRRDGLFLRIPLADLRRDSDGDGLSDIAARHLLLENDGPRASLVGSVGQDCPADGGAGSPIGLALQHILGGDEQALFEPVDRTSSQILGAKRLTVSGGHRPLMVRGDPVDYGCLRLKVPIIVYGPAQLDAMRSHSPDFRTISLDPLTYNRDRTRAFMKWSTGWRGGTLVFRKVAGKWTAGVTSDWIT